MRGRDEDRTGTAAQTGGGADLPAVGKRSRVDDVQVLDATRGAMVQPGTSYAWARDDRSGGGPARGAPAGGGAVQFLGVGPFGHMGPGGIPGMPTSPPSPQIDSFHYFQKHGKAHFTELTQIDMGPMTLATGSRFAAWEGGNSHRFAAGFARELFVDVVLSPWDLAEQTLAPASLHRLIETGRDAENNDAPAKANDYQPGVTLELQKAYRQQLREALVRLVPRVMEEWNRRTLADHAARARTASIALPEHPETNQPGVGILQSHPIDRFVLAALWGSIKPVLVPDFKAYRKAFPSEAVPHGAREAQPAAPRPVAFSWQAATGARHWIKVSDPIDATPEEVAHELYGDTRRAYLVTPAPPLFGFDPLGHGLVPRHQAALQKASGAPSAGGTVVHEILAGPQADAAALDQAAGFTAGKTSPAAVIQQLDLVIRKLREIAASAASWVTLDKDVQAAAARAEHRKQQLASAVDPREAEQWNAQTREQLDIAGKCSSGLAAASQMFHGFTAPEPRDLAWQIATLFVQAAASSDLVVTARQYLDRATQRMLAFPSDWVDAQFRWIRRALQASLTSARTGKDDASVKYLATREAALRGDLMKVRDQLLSNPLAALDEVERVTKEIKQLATGASAVRNIERCNEVFVQLKEAKSPAGWIRSLVSNPVTGNHGNDRLDALAGRAEKFQGEWNAILARWQSGDQDGAAAALDTRTAKGGEWDGFFTDVAKEIKDQATYDAWMLFGLMVGIAIVTGFAGAAIEPAIIGALGPVLGFAITVATDAAIFTSLSYFLVDKHPSLSGFKDEYLHNLMTFGVLKGVSKGWGALEKLLGVRMKTGEVIAQFATMNGIALYEASQDKARRGETLTEAEILKISFNNLTFLIAVSIGNRLAAPAVGRWRLRGAVGQELERFEALHQEVTLIADAIKADKARSDKAVTDKLLERQRALIEAERTLIDGLVELTSKGWEHARKQGMTREQFDAVAAARDDLSAASRGLREAEIMSRLEPVPPNQYLSAKGKPFDDAREHFAGDKANHVTDVATDPASHTRSFEVVLPDGTTLHIAERAGEVGDVSTATKPVVTPGGEPPPPRAEEVARAHGIEAAQLPMFEAQYRQRPAKLLAFLEAVRGQPGLANRLLARFGDATLGHFEPMGGDMLAMYGEIEISAGKLDELATKDIDDIRKLIEVAHSQGRASEDDYQYFESTSTNRKPGARLRFKSRVAARVHTVTTAILGDLGISSSDPRAKLFENVSPGDALRLWDLKNEAGYNDPEVRKPAADWAFGKVGKQPDSPSKVREFVAAFQFCDAELERQGDVVLAEARTELTKELAAETTRKGGGALSPAETVAVTRRVTAKELGRELPEVGPKAKKAAKQQAARKLAQNLPLGDATGAHPGAKDATNAAWKTNTEAQTGHRASGPTAVDGAAAASNDELPARVKATADRLGFGSLADGAYHAHKHAAELAKPTTQATEMADYLDAARKFIRDNPGTTRVNQDGSRSVEFKVGNMRAIVAVGADGSASISTFGKVPQ
jgi:hypothetical protein